MRSNVLFAKMVGNLLISVLFVLLWGDWAVSKQPIQIEADKMTAMSKSQYVTFSGNVDAKQGDIRIRSDEMTVHYLQDENSANGSREAQQVEKIVCTGNVEVTSKEWLGTSDTMHYISRENVVQLIGNAKAFKGKNMVEGERIHYYLDTGKSEVLGAKAVVKEEKADGEKSGRVNMTILEQ